MTTTLRARCAAVLFTLACAATPLRAQPMGGGPGGMGGGFGPDGDPAMAFPMILRSLGLTPEQHEKMHAIMDAHRPRFQSLFGELRAAQDAMNERLFASGPLAAADLDPQIDRVGRARTQLMREGAAVAIELRGLLTPDQLRKAGDTRTRLDQLRAEARRLLGEPGPPPAP